MTKIKLMAVLLSATTVLSTAAFALDKPSAQTTADHDFTKLSTQGLKAFQDVRQARIDIFNGDTQQAKSDVADAKAAIAKASTDDTKFIKAEAELNQPASTTTPSKAAASTTPTAWIPVNGTLAIDEDYAKSPAKTASMAKANEKLQKGDQKGAMDTLKLAQIDAVFVAEVAPLDKSTSGIDQAAQMIDAGHYYQANQVLKGIEDGVRFDQIDVTSVPQKTASNAASGTKTASTTPTTSTK